ncbi:helix-turn-helix domain-containing protein [Phaeobacter sp. 11ANDIMAR09]|uniref:helix-turn-helix domain-containing protein n=1 Tax=Phaeobacter sp. 11ANDIMAR09 TaxID=1225647 RepID=UPI0009F87FFC
MNATSPIHEFEGKTLGHAIQEVERHYFCYCLNKANGNKAKAARVAGLSYQTFIRKLGLLELRITYHAE